MSSSNISENMSGHTTNRLESTPTKSTSPCGAVTPAVTTITTTTSGDIPESREAMMFRTFPCIHHTLGCKNRLHPKGSACTRCISQFRGRSSGDRDGDPTIEAIKNSITPARYCIEVIDNHNKKLIPWPDSLPHATHAELTLAISLAWAKLLRAINTTRLPQVFGPEHLAVVAAEQILAEFKDVPRVKHDLDEWLKARSEQELRERFYRMVRRLVRSTDCQNQKYWVARAPSADD